MNIDEIVFNKEILNFCSDIYNLINISNEEIKNLSQKNSKLNELTKTLNTNEKLVISLAYELFLLKYVVKKDVSSLGINEQLLEKSSRYRQELSIKKIFEFFFINEGVNLDNDVKKWILNGIVSIGNYDFNTSKFNLKIDDYSPLINFNKSLVINCLDEIGYDLKSSDLIEKNDIKNMIYKNNFLNLYNKKYNEFITNQEKLIDSIKKDDSYNRLSINSKLLDIYDSYIKCGKFFIDDLAFFNNYELELFLSDANLVAIYEFLTSFMNEYDYEVVNNCKKSVILKV